jgi:hypothetical protein
MVRDIIVVANDIKLYYRGFELALERDNLDDAIHYLKEIQREVNEYLGYLGEKKKRAVKEVAIRQNLKAQIKEHKTHVKKLKRELKRHKFPLSETPDDSKNSRKPMRIPAVFPTILKAVQITRADPERMVEEEEKNGSPEILVESADRIPMIVSKIGEEIHSDDSNESVKTVGILSDGPDPSGAPIQYRPGKSQIAAQGTGVHLQKADREKLVKVAEVSECLSLSQWSELLGFRRSSSAHVFLQRMSDKGLVELQNTLEGVAVRLSVIGKSALDEIEVADVK